MRWFVGTAGVFMWLAVLVNGIWAQRATINAPSRNSIHDTDRRAVVSPQGTTSKRPNPAPAPDQGRADGTLPSKEQVNNATVTIITAPVGGAFAAMGSDMANVLDDGENLRVLPIIGKGSVQNLIDIMRLRNVDMGFVVSDAVEFVKTEYHVPNMEDRVRYIAKLFNNDLHIVARKDIKTIRDLAGRKIFSDRNLGYFALRNVFNRLKITADIDFRTDDAGGLQRMLAGEADAWIVSAGKVAPI